MPPKHDAGTATRHYRAFWQRSCRAAAAGAVLKPSGGNCAVLPYLHFPPIQQPAAPPWNIPTGRAAGCFYFWQYRTIPALRLKHRSGSCGTASALPKCSIMSGCGTRIVLRGQKPLALCDRCPCFGSLFPPLAALTFAASSIICAFGLAAAAPRSPYRHLELCGIAFIFVCLWVQCAVNQHAQVLYGR